MDFERRPLAGPETLGQRLRNLREERRQTVDDLAHELRVAAKYLTAVEESRYHDLPGKVYALNFVKLYIRWAGLNERAALERFRQEYDVAQAARPTKRPILAQRANTELPWWRRQMRFLLAGVVIVTVLGYFGWQVYQLYAPAELVVIQPSKDFATTEDTITVSGTTEPGVVIRINGDEVAVDRDGKFEVNVDLVEGLNVLQITASKPRASDQEVIRQVLREKSLSPEAGQ